MVVAITVATRTSVRMAMMLINVVVAHMIAIRIAHAVVWHAMAYRHNHHGGHMLSDTMRMTIVITTH